MNPSKKFGLSTRRVKGGKKVPQGTKSKRVQVVLPASIARAFMPKPIHVPTTCIENG